MTFRLYNTLTRNIEEVKPLRDDEIRMYTCGPTIYHYVHIGNFRTFLFQDILRRHILSKGYKLTHVMNITDVEDKIIANSRSEGLSIEEYTAQFETAFLDDMDRLRIQHPEVMPKATEHIEDMLKLVAALREKGFTYESEGSTYYRIDAFQPYGRLSQLQVGTELHEARTDDDKYSKENPRDFVLWKARREGETSWSSAFGEGRPGWHLECSAMSMKYLGESFDIHCGGVDLIFPHHENEIAQSEGATGRPFVRYWIHGAHLIIDGQKMSKSLGNFFTLRDLLDRDCDPLALRYLLASVHYRKQLNFTFEGVTQAQRSIQRVNDFLLRVKEIKSDFLGDDSLSRRVVGARRQFQEALDDDLNTSAALAAVFELIRDVNPRLELHEVGGKTRNDLLGFFREVNQIFDVFRIEDDQFDDDQIGVLIEQRKQARRSRNFERADEIRTILAERGILLEDTREGTRWKRRN